MAFQAFGESVEKNAVRLCRNFIFKSFKMNGRHEETRTPDLYRVNLPALGFSTTYNTVGTA